MEKEPLPQNIRRASREEHFGEKKLKPTEKKGYYQHDPVVVDVGPEYQARVKELRAISKQLNIQLQKDIEQTDLPVTTKKKTKSILRIAFQFCPPFVSTQEEEEKKGQRFTPAGDEVVIFWHVNQNNSFNSIRTGSQPWNHAMLYSYDFDPTFNPNEEKEQLKNDIEKQDTKKLSDYIIEKLKSNPIIQLYKKAEQITDIEQTQKYFSDYSFVSINDNVISNLLKQILLNILKAQAKQIDLQKTTPQQISELIKNIINEFLNIGVKDLGESNTSARSILVKNMNENNFEALIGDFTKQAKDHYKTKKFQKK